jgi:hypothetical protein
MPDDVREYHEAVRKALGERGKDMTTEELREEELLVHLTRLGTDDEGLRDDPEDVELVDRVVARMEEGAEPDPGLTAWINEHVVVWSR